MELEEEIEASIGEVRTETLDMSFGELANLHLNSELVIQPEYQRLFRWSDHQKSHLIESIMIRLPIPQLFVIENADGVLELIDGLQRTSSVLQFIDANSLGLEPLELSGCSLVKSLNGVKYEDLPLSLKLNLKRSPIRVVVIKRQSKGFLRYEMFKRLNTGGSNLEPQEIRNCSARMLGDGGVAFYSFLVELTQDPNFAACTEFLPQQEKDKKGVEELVLRYFATKNSLGTFKGSVRDWLDNYMEDVLLNRMDFDYDVERENFTSVFKFALENLGNTAFLRYRGNDAVGALPPAYFEAISVGISSCLDQIAGKPSVQLREAITRLVQSNEFRAVTGPGANSREKMQTRIALAADSLVSA